VANSYRGRNEEKGPTPYDQEIDIDLSELEKIIRNLKSQFKGEVAKVQPEVKHTNQHKHLYTDSYII
jgi:hypothetical protein